MTKKKSNLPESYFFKKVVEIPMYGGNFIIIFSNDPVKIAKVVNALPSQLINIYAQTFHGFMYGGKESFAVIFNFWDTYAITIGTITHEVTHAGNRLLLSREFEPDWINDEAEAYLKSWMADEVQDFIQQCGLAQ